jgi:hypothetical protein
MSTKEQIKRYIQSLPEQKQSDMQALHNLMLKIKPACKLWFHSSQSLRRDSALHEHQSYE